MIPLISKLLLGRKIIKVVADGASDYGDSDGDGNTLSECYTPNGSILLVLDNGNVLRAWNSEWGGVSILSYDEMERYKYLIDGDTPCQ